MVSWIRTPVVTLIFVTACGRSSAEPAAKPASQDVAAEPVEVEPAVVEPVASKATVYPDAAAFDFRMAQLDPEMIGTTQRCDVKSVDLAKDDETRRIGVRCGGGPQGSYITFARSSDVSAALKDETQIEVTIDAAGVEPGDGDARVTLVKVIGELRPPERPSRCKCKYDRDQAREAERPKRPEGWSFALFEKDHDKYWGKTQVCVISSVQDVMRTSSDAREYSIGRVFDAETLPYAARIYCASPTGGSAVIVGARSAHQLLNLEQGQAIQIELGWVTRWSHQATGKLGSTVYQPTHDSYD